MFSGINTLPMMRKWLFMGGCLFICSLGFSQDNSGYINRYKDIAVAEMQRTGIPASIKLAQAMLESNCGKSDLACNANNHFGIKCGNDWDGKCFHKEDDDYQDGKITKSCFREYSSVYDSYVAHSDFLVDPSKSNRYGFLFKLDPTDYKAWAKGLAKSGYATDPKYADRLIDIIEKYQLYNLDMDSPGPESIALVKPTKQKHKTGYQNDVKYVVAIDGDSPASLALEVDVTPRQIVRYNDGIKDEDQPLKAGSYVYLQPKRNKFNGHQPYHMLKQGDDLVSVSQKYGIKMSALLKRNGLADGEIPMPNQRIMLRGKPKNALRVADPYTIPDEKVADHSREVMNDSLGMEVASIQREITSPSLKEKPVNTTPVSSPHSTPVTTQSTSKPIVQSVNPKTPPAPIPAKEHMVAKGETLYGIARSYGMTVDELKKMNNLSADTIHIGQNLLVK
jgi:LysM repeat protein